MNQTNQQPTREELAIQLVTMANSKYGLTSYYQIEENHFALHSKLNEFKERFVYDKKEYQHKKALYKKGAAAWHQLKEVSLRLFRMQLEEIENEKVDAFFRIRRVRKGTNRKKVQVA